MASPATTATRTTARSASFRCPTRRRWRTTRSKVYQNNHWDLTAEHRLRRRRQARRLPPVAMPAKIGDPSLIKHVFMIIRENRTYDQILGDVAAGNGDPSLAVFGANDTPNAHNLVKRFPLLDNFYDPEPPVGRRPPVDRRGDGALRGRHPVAGLGAQLSRRQRRRFARLPEEGLPVPGGGGRRPVRRRSTANMSRTTIWLASRTAELVRSSTPTRRASRPAQKRRSSTRTPSSPSRRSRWCRSTSSRTSRSST